MAGVSCRGAACALRPSRQPRRGRPIHEDRPGRDDGRRRPARDDALPAGGRRRRRPAGPAIMHVPRPRRQPRTSINALAEQTFATQGYAVLTSDARGHGAVGRARSTLDGPREIAGRARAASTGSPARPRSTTRTSAPGASRSAAARLGRARGGRPVRRGRGRTRRGSTCTRRSLRSGLTKSGAVFRFLELGPGRPYGARADTRSRATRSNSTNLGGARRRTPTRAPSNGALERIRRRRSSSRDGATSRSGSSRAIAAYQRPRRAEAPLHRRLRPRAVDVPGAGPDVVFAESTRLVRPVPEGRCRTESTSASRSSSRPTRIATAHNVSYAGLPPTTIVKTATRTVGRTIGSRGKARRDASRSRSGSSRSSARRSSPSRRRRDEGDAARRRPRGRRARRNGDDRQRGRHAAPTRSQGVDALVPAASTTPR